MANQEVDLGFDFNEGVGESTSIPLVTNQLKAGERVTLTCKLLSVVKDPNAYKGSCFWVTVDVLESSDENKAGTGKQRINLKVGDKKQASYSIKDLRHIVAACNSTNPEDKAQDYNGMIVDVVTVGEDVAELEMKFAIDLVANPKKPVEGAPGMFYASRYFKPAA